MDYGSNPAKNQIRQKYTGLTYLRKGTEIKNCLQMFQLKLIGFPTA